MKSHLRQLLRLGISPTAKNTYILFTGNVLDAFFAFLFTVLVFRLLATADFGIFSAINNFIIVTYSVLDVGISSGLINFISYHRSRGQDELARRYFYTGLLLRAILALVVAAVVAAASGWIAPKFFLTAQSQTLILAAVAIFGLSLIDLFYYSFQAYQKFASSALTALSFTSTRLLQLGLVLLLGLPFSLPVALLITAIAPLIGIVPALRGLGFNWQFPHPEAKIFKSLVSFSGWMGVARVFSTLAGRLDVQLMLLLAGPASAGTYSVAARIASFYAIIVTSFTAVLAPKFAAGWKLSRMKPFVLKSALTLVGLVAAMGLGIVIARPFILLLFGVKATASILPFQALTLAFMPFVASVLPTTIIIYNLKLPKVVGTLAVGQFALLLIGQWWLIPRFGSLGPAIAIGITNLVIMIISYVVVWRKWH